MFKSRINWNDEEILKLKNDLLSGKTYKQCGESRDLGRARIMQLVKKFDLFPNGEVFGKSVIALEKQRLADEFHFQKWRKHKDEPRILDEFYLICRKKFLRKKNNCNRDTVEFNIDFADIEWPTHCPMLGIELFYHSKVGVSFDNAPSFDRIDPSKGYIKGNVHIISMRANRIKDNASTSELKMIYDYLVKLEELS